MKTKYLQAKTAKLISLKKKSFTSGPTAFSTGAATLNPHRPLFRVRQPALTAGNRPNVPLPSPHDYESNFDSSHLDTLTQNAQVIHENLVANTPHTRSQPTTGPYHPSLGRVPPAGRHTPRPTTPAPENPSLSGAAEPATMRAKGSRFARAPPMIPYSTVSPGTTSGATSPTPLQISPR